MPVAVVRVLVGGDHAGPGLDQGGLDVARVVLSRQQIQAFVALQDFLGDDAVLRHAAVQLVAVGGVRALVIHVGLDDKPLADVELVFELSPTPTTVSATSWPITTGSRCMSRPCSRGCSGPRLMILMSEKQMPQASCRTSSSSGPYWGRGIVHFLQRVQSRAVQVPPLDLVGQRLLCRLVLRDFFVSVVSDICHNFS